MKQGQRVRYTDRGRERLWGLLVAAVLAAGVLWAIAQVLGWPLWARAVLAGLAAAPPVVGALRALLGQPETRAQWVDQRVKLSGGHGRLPRVRDVDDLKQLGVHAAQVQVPYIERDKQVEFEEAIGPGRAVLLVGPSMSGKTRLAAEVVKRKFPKAPLIAAESGKALRELFDGGLVPADAVIWLNDLEQFLGVDGLTVGLLNRLTSGRAIMVATILAWKKMTYQPVNGLRPPELEVLQQFREISLQSRLTDSELDRVRATVNDPGVLAAVDHYGLAEYLGAGPDAIDRFNWGEPVGHALVRAAVDWRRTGLIRPVSQQVLVKALDTYLADQPDVPRTNQEIDKGLAWAIEKISQTVALLNPDYTDANQTTFKAFDYLIDQPAITSIPVPDPMWALALELAGSVELTTIGLAAYHAGKLDTAATAWRRAADEGDSKWAPIASDILRAYLAERVLLEGVEAAYQQVIGSAGPRALVALGTLFKEQDLLVGAKAAYQQAIASRDADWAPRAAFKLGQLLAEHDDVEEAKTAYRWAIANALQGDEVAPAAARYLGELLEERRDFEGAKAAYQQAIASGHADWAPEAAYALGTLLLIKQNDLAGATAAYQQALDSGHAKWAPEAASILGALRER